jgi:hypothetical protein
MKNVHKTFHRNILTIFSSIFISFAFSPVNFAAQDDDTEKNSSEEKVDGDAPKKPKGMPGEKAKLMNIDEKMVSIFLWKAL